MTKAHSLNWNVLTPIISAASLVLPDRHPRPSDPAALEVADDEQDHRDQDQTQPVPPGSVVRIAHGVTAEK